MASEGAPAIPGQMLPSSQRSRAFAQLLEFPPFLPQSKHTRSTRAPREVLLFRTSCLNSLCPRIPHLPPTQRYSFRSLAVKPCDWHSLQSNRDFQVSFRLFQLCIIRSSNSDLLRFFLHLWQDSGVHAIQIAADPSNERWSFCFVHSLQT